MDNLCKRCYHNYVCEQYNENRDFKRTECDYKNSHFVDASYVAPVLHGRWISLRKGDWTSVYECSECKRKETVCCDRNKADEQVNRLYPYCHCGAKMDLE